MQARVVRLTPHLIVHEVLRHGPLAGVGLGHDPLPLAQSHHLLAITVSLGMFFTWSLQLVLVPGLQEAAVISSQCFRSTYLVTWWGSCLGTSLHSSLETSLQE